MSEERILSILHRAGATEEELGQAGRVLELWRRGEIDPEDVFYFIMGLAREKFIPLTPREVGDIRALLGLSRE